ncbi:hypothetical protein [Parvibaculum sp.]|uniref:hypothetical protein n=1 Tax=Parvibaculum sp. TaxID=2024848 RepID=UPI00329A0BED
MRLGENGHAMQPERTAELADDAEELCNGGGRFFLHFAFKCAAREIAGEEIVERGAHEPDAKIREAESGRRCIHEEYGRQMADDIGGAHIGARRESPAIALALPIGKHLAQARILKSEQRVYIEIEGCKP